MRTQFGWGGGGGGGGGVVEGTGSERIERRDGKRMWFAK